MNNKAPLILVVEDENALVTLLRYNLEREGFQVIEAGDGEEALLLAREQQPDLILLDWMLPLLSGIEVCRQLRRLPETRSVPIITSWSASKRCRATVAISGHARSNSSQRTTTS